MEKAWKYYYKLFPLVHKALCEKPTRASLIKLKEYIFLLFRQTKPANAVLNTAVSPYKKQGRKSGDLGVHSKSSVIRTLLQRKHKINLYKTFTRMTFARPSFTTLLWKQPRPLNNYPEIPQQNPSSRSINTPKFPCELTALNGPWDAWNPAGKLRAAPGCGQPLALPRCRCRHRAQPAQSCPEHGRCLAEAPEPSHQVPASPSRRAGPAGAPRVGAWAGSRRPPLRPLPGAAPAARPAAPARGPHAGAAVPGRRTSSPRASTSCPAAEPPTPAIRPLPDTQRATTRPRCPCPAPRRRAGPGEAPDGRSPWWGLCGPLPSRLGRTLRAAAAAALPPAAAAPGSSRALPPPSPAHAQCGEPGALTGGGPGRVPRERRRRTALARRWGRGEHQEDLGPSREGREGKSPPRLLEAVTGWAPRGCGGGRPRCGLPAAPQPGTRCSVGESPCVFLFRQYQKVKHFSSIQCERQGRVAAVPGGLNTERARLENPPGFPGWIRGRGKIACWAATDSWGRWSLGAAALQRSTCTPVRFPWFPWSRLWSPFWGCGQM